MSGQGVSTWPSGARFEGRFADDEMVEGTYRFPNGAVYVGEVRDSKLHGRGRYTRASGEVWHDGLWSNNQPVE